MRPRLLANCLALGLVTACHSPPQVEAVLAGSTMGSEWTVKIVGEMPKQPNALRADIQSQFDRVVAQLSTYERDSALSRFNTNSGEGWQVLPMELFSVMAYALELAAATRGAYDITAGPLVNLWGFGTASARSAPPTQQEIAAALSKVGWQRVTLNGPMHSARRPAGTYVDLSSLGKGFGVDAVAQYLDDQGVHNYLIDLSGKLRARGVNARGDAWNVAVEQPGPDPVDGTSSALPVVAQLTDESVATAGNYRQWFHAAGREYSHLVDPATGWPIAHDIRSVTVIADDCMTADAWATALIVMQPAAARALAEERGLAAIFILGEGVEQRMWTSFSWRERRE
jgi:FAD:protein FMN transferase